MSNYFLSEGDLNGFVTNLMAKCPVVAPVAKRTRFVFDELATTDDLRLDYDTTILPPKKVFFPPKQDLVTFDGESYKDCINPVEKVLFGVHPHDIKAIDMTDNVFELPGPGRSNGVYPPGVHSSIERPAYKWVMDPFPAPSNF